MNDNPTTSPPPPLPPKPESLDSNASIMTVSECLLKTPYNLIETMHMSGQTGKLTRQLSLLTIAGLIVFGVTLGSFSFGHQLWAAPVKTIFGVIFSAIICLPSLYIFAALTGAPLKFAQIAQGLAGALALTAALLLGFTPILWVFSQSTSSEPFFGFLVILGWIISVGFGTGFLVKMLVHTGIEKRGPLKIWIGIFLLVTLQMSTTLRPVIGTSDHFFTTEKRFFLEHWLAEMTGPNKRAPELPDEYRQRGE